MSEQPTAQYASRRTLMALATVPLAVAVIWSVYHVLGIIAAVTGRGNPLALTWVMSFLLLWWVVAAWFEKPYVATPRQAAQLAAKTVTVVVPCYNEDPQALTACLQSLFTQTRRIDRIAVVDDGSTVDYHPAMHKLVAAVHGVSLDWQRQENAGKRHAQMAAITGDTSDVIVTVDSDSVLDAHAIEQGLMPFADPEVTSVAGMVAVLNYRKNFLTRLTGMLYTPFTRGFRSAQSVFGRVMVNSGTLGFYRADVLHKYASGYAGEEFLGRPMQMNDDSMMTFYGLLEGKAVHQPTAVAFTLVPDQLRHYFAQQKRWMRGTFVRTWWWIRYMPLNDLAFWMPLAELLAFVLSLVVVVALAVALPRFDGADPERFWLFTAATGILMNYIIALRYFTVRRSDESIWQALATFALAPVAGLWRLLLLRPLYLYSYLTFWKVSKWGTRETGVEVTV